MKISVLILAAGLGTRMKSNKPKVLQELCGKSMILHILKQAFQISDDVSVVLSYQKENIEEEIKKAYPQTQFIEQDLQNFPGTAGAVKNYMPKGDKVLILCGDMPLIQTTSLKTLSDQNSSFSLAVFQTQNAKNYGRVIIENKKVQKIVEFKDASESEKALQICNAGVYSIDTQILKELLPQINNQNASKEYYLTDSVKLAVEKGIQVNPVYVDEDEFMGVNDKFELARAENLMQERIKKHWAEQGVIFHLPQTSFIGADVEFKGECEIYESVRLEGKSFIENSIIKSSSVVENSIIKNSDIGPLAHVRPKCEIVDTHIGNFVECKNAKLYKVKAGHLSYLGDCEIDEGTNIGCGTITCNYDGLKKHPTKIGKNAFIGSDTQLIAPVVIEDDVLIAAGSCVSTNIPKGSLFISRAQGQIIKDYFYQKFGKKE
ncbi:bifunctional UDP-N-acetylglucosamine diphosphorylase/glucosamine-1-phosphate N-acetyltransferase GlmU [Campylobacter sp. MIT 99-7217]|uniref:bifunctional UDP-N-acetylglucosamine diphosphorylase/glucosamine-1-phosphate N-acetyltransferase GlmU n=1 Tax=Campylobacter sp. MIT 99-7217 TaxID=535091 RepID=UPI00115943D6|nr:bifunctional UDP-N-acetylglucosamine diphosphorylase/glucosamine-1-phosphate N-acetyltransferase GlmU [Campylobacter sp. MIT 99-7217]TQR34531.1 bifunctional UDP-N-acetylglucosamine diphosphorylase/glucosamine-1-phosphate N-acetyltransferase GlmU [Campylobacter sp. MIT 99-7217]